MYNIFVAHLHYTLKLTRGMLEMNHDRPQYLVEQRDLVWVSPRVQDTAGLYLISRVFSDKKNPMFKKSNVKFTPFHD